MRLINLLTVLLLFSISLKAEGNESDENLKVDPATKPTIRETIAAVGLRDTRYVYGTYFPVKNFGIKVEQSLYSVAIGYQRTGLELSYSHIFPKGLSLSEYISGATTWKGSYQVFRAGVNLNWRYRFFQLSGAIAPSYDTGIGYYTPWQAGFEILLPKEISFIAAYSTIPEYRMSEKRLQAGFGFKVLNLTVSPRVSFAMENNRCFQDLRVLVSMEYKFFK